MDTRVKTLSEAISLLEEIDREQQKIQKAYGNESKWSEAQKVELIRRGIRHSIKAIKKLAQEKIIVV